MFQARDVAQHSAQGSVPPVLKTDHQVGSAGALAGDGFSALTALRSIAWDNVKCTSGYIVVLSSSPMSAPP